MNAPNDTSMQNLASISKKQACKEIEQSLAGLQILKALLGEKKFNKRIKKAAALLSRELPKNKKAPKKVKAALPGTTVPDAVVPALPAI